MANGTTSLRLAYAFLPAPNPIRASVGGTDLNPAYRKAMRKRKVWPEPLFAEAKQWHGLRQFRLRGLQQVNMEGLLIAAGQNLKRWLATTGWGWRSGPTGNLTASNSASTPWGCDV